MTGTTPGGSGFGRPRPARRFRPPGTRPRWISALYALIIVGSVGGVSLIGAKNPIGTPGPPAAVSQGLSASATASPTTQSPSPSPTTASPSPSATTASPSPSASHSAPPNGPMQVNVATGDVFAGAGPKAIDRYFAAAAKIGFQGVRTDFHVSDGWATGRLITAAAAKYGLKVRAIIDGFPSGTPTVTEARKGCKSFANTFKGSDVITVVEFINEPNARSAYYGHPERYLKLYASCYGAIAASGWHVKVETGATSPVGTTNPTDGMTAPAWFTGLYAAGLARYGCDQGMNPADWPRTVTPSDPNWKQISTVHDIMAAHGKGHCRLDVAEMGFPTGGGDFPPATVRSPQWKPLQPVSVANQARFIEDTLKAAYNLRLQGIVGSVGIYQLIDNTHAQVLDPSVASTEAHFGILYAAGNNPLAPGKPKCQRLGKAQYCAASTIATFIADHRS